jgi:hypothetical protein
MEPGGLHQGERRWEPLRLSILWVDFNIKVHGWIVGTRERNRLI